MISLCMIVKNEEELLGNCLKSADSFFNDIVVIDTGSDDKTKEIAQGYGARIYDFEWIHDFSAARNYAAGKAKNDWVFVLDADNTIISFDEVNVNEFISNSNCVGRVIIRDYESEKTGHCFKECTPRLYNRKYYAYSGKIHEQITPIDQALEYKAESVPIELMHYGYSSEIVDYNSKLERNSRMLLKELEQTPDDPYLLYQMGKSYFAMDRDINKACEYFEKALNQNPNHILEYVGSLIECYGYTLLRSGQYKKSLELVKYRARYENNPGFRFMLGHVYLNNAKFIEAVECFEGCIGKTDGGIGSYMSYYNIGVILECIGMRDDAAIYYQKCGDYAQAQARLKDLFA